MMQMAALSVAFSNLCMYGCMHENRNCFYCKINGSTLPFKNACFNYSNEVLQFHLCSLLHTFSTVADLHKLKDLIAAVSFEPTHSSQGYT